MHIATLISGFLGTKYLKEFVPLTVEWKEVEVRCLEASQGNRYHIISAQVPKGWSVRAEVSVLNYIALNTHISSQDRTFTDVSNAGWSTTLGVASFREPMQNKADLDLAKSFVHRGRPFLVRKRDCPDTSY